MTTWAGVQVCSSVLPLSLLALPSLLERRTIACSWEDALFWGLEYVSSMSADQSMLAKWRILHGVDRCRDFTIASGKALTPFGN